MCLFGSHFSDATANIPNPRLRAEKAPGNNQTLRMALVAEKSERVSNPLGSIRASSGVLRSLGKQLQNVGRFIWCLLLGYQDDGKAVSRDGQL